MFGRFLRAVYGSIIKAAGDTISAVKNYLVGSSPPKSPEVVEFEAAAKKELVSTSPSKPAQTPPTVPSAPLTTTIEDFVESVLETPAKEIGVKRMRRAAKNLYETLRRRVSTPYPPASRPGQSPHLRTGTGRRSIRVDVGSSEITIGIDSSGYYMGYHETGNTRDGAVRPWVAPVLSYHQFQAISHLIQNEVE